MSVVRLLFHTGGCLSSLLPVHDGDPGWNHEELVASVFNSRRNTLG